MTNKSSELSSVISAIEILNNQATKEDIQSSERIIQDYINSTKLRANLLHGNYEAGLRLTAPVFADKRGDINELPHLGIIISLLARLKKARGENRLNSFQYTDTSMQELNTLIDLVIGSNDISPEGVISIFRDYEGRKNAGNIIRLTPAA